MRALKSTPWLAIGRAAFLAVVAWAFLSALLWIASQSIPIFASLLNLLLGQPISLLTNVIIGVGIGGLATLRLEKSEQILNTTSLWCLVVAVTVGMLIYDYFPIGIYRLIIRFNQPTLIGLMLGVFWKGRKYWR